MPQASKRADVRGTVGIGTLRQGVGIGPGSSSEGLALRASLTPGRTRAQLNARGHGAFPSAWLGMQHASDDLRGLWVRQMPTIGYQPMWPHGKT